MRVFCEGSDLLSTELVVVDGAVVLRVSVDDVAGLGGAFGRQGENASADELRKDVSPVHARDLLSAVNVAAGYGSGAHSRHPPAVLVRVVVDGLVSSRPGQRIESGMRLFALAHRPTQVGRPAALRDHVHLFPCRLSYVSNPQVAGDAIETEAPRVTQPIVQNATIDLSATHVAAREIASRRSVEFVHVDPQDATEGFTHVLAVAELLIVPGAPIITVAAIAQPKIEVAIGAKHDVATIVVTLGLIELQDALDLYGRAVGAHFVNVESALAASAKDVRRARRHV